MNQHLPYNILLALTVVMIGAVVLYNTLGRERYETTLYYSYPVVEQQEPSSLPEPERVLPEDGDDTVSEVESTEEVPPSVAVTQVRFPLDINAASVEELQFIPRVGNVMAQRIVQYRAVLGGYTDLEQLKEIKGVGDQTYQHLYSYLYIDNGDGFYSDSLQTEEEDAEEEESEVSEESEEAEDEELELEIAS